MDELIPFPFIASENQPRDGAAFVVPEYCVRCDNRVCLLAKTLPSMKVSKCHKSKHYFKITFLQKEYILVGLEDFPRKHKGKVTCPVQAAMRWASRIASYQQLVEDHVKKTVSTSLAPLHDVKTAVSIISRNAESIITDSGKGIVGDFEAKVNGSPAPLKTLYKSVQLLNDRLSMMDLLANPASAKHGQQRSCDVRRLFDKYRIMFQPIAEQKGIRLTLTGTTRRNHAVYDSFATIPLILLDNAIKYSTDRQEVAISVHDSKGGTKIEIVSFGPYSPPEEVATLFDRGVRGKNAEKFASKGAGLGLYLAKVVAKAHGIHLEYTSTRSVEMNGVMCGENRVSFTLT